MKVLHIDSSVLGENSVSRKISAGVMVKLKAAQPDADVLYRDLAVDTVPHLSGAYLAASQGMTSEHEPELQADLAIGEAVLEEFLEADAVVIGVAFYNLTVSSQLKAWLDRIMIVGKTFKYSAQGELQGMMGSKRVILGISRGGIYLEGTPGGAIEHCETFLKAIFAFIGVTNLDIIVADGVNVGPEHRAQALEHVDKELALLSF
ncbi:FMN-dependent NADH-azoreductase [Novosphingobium beihaiensis]|uniref:FMN dependent NADH:quinone oxidoreductase n=1 Tax=Novosphingobium beihaiensis TaxID=2930389 RepID=A0ABT0BRM5_9SPHN|nr:NAD(P)H-dependent oxidoreductase [Novosphingobium beihaiensis]MCJ2187628.1 NAD(P)H-dependent oxidoreductase [Novosphingobium beihaiensis]